MNAPETLRNHLEKYGQEHLMKFWDELDNDQRQHLKQELDELDFSELQSFFQRVTQDSNESNGSEKLDNKLQPIEESQFLSIRRTSPALIKQYEAEGLEQIANGHVAVLLMAGGQGTRLGSSNPKGMYDVGLLSRKPLFQIQAERIRTLQRLAFQKTGKNGRITWYIMTSEHTMEPTKAFFERNHYFGLNVDDVIMFEQGSLPCFSFDGKIILDQKHVVAKAPDGNGGIYRALKSQGILDDLERRGILYLHAHSVDNILIKVADPVFVGYCVQQKADCGAKVVEKSQPNEAVGVICIVDGKYQVVEYSEISTKASEQRNSDGRLTFNAGNICNHFFTTEFLQKIGNTFEQRLKLHVAKKKIPFVDNAGKRCTPEKPNGIKIEKFVFDVFEFTEKFAVLAVEREDEFSPLKNAESAGKECATTARNDIYRYHKKLVEAAGGHVNGDECEISPLLSYDGEGLEQLVGGKSLDAPIHLKSKHEEKQHNGTTTTNGC